MAIFVLRDLFKRLVNGKPPLMNGKKPTVHWGLVPIHFGTVGMLPEKSYQALLVVA